MEKTATLRIAGDIMLGGSVLKKVEKYGSFYPFEKLVRKMKPSDIFFANLECTLFSNNKPPYPKKVLLLSSPTVVGGLKDAGINIVSLANNHSFDYGLNAFIKTKTTLEKNDIKCVGGGKDIIQASNFTSFEANGLQFGFLSYCSEHTDCRHFASNLTYGVSSVDPEIIYKDINRAKSKSDFVIVALHWGYEFMNYPTPQNIRIAKDLIEMGATIVAGSHTHVFQGYEQYKNGLIIYDLGSLIFGDILIRAPSQDGYYLKKRNHREGMIVDCVFKQDGLAHYEFQPIFINSNFQATVPEKFERQRILNRFERQSKRIIMQNYESFHKGYMLKRNTINYLSSITLLNRIYRFCKKIFYLTTQ